MSLKRFYIFGDSITYGSFDVEGGWIQRLRKYFDSKSMDFRVYNLGITINQTTETILNRFEFEMKERTDQEDKNIIIFAIGINDSFIINNKNAVQIEKEKFKKNILKLMKLSKQFSNKIIFIGLTPVEESKTTLIASSQGKISYRNDYIEKYNAIIREVCREKNIYFIEVFDEWKKIKYKKLLKDGLHPNSNGHKKIFELVKWFLVKNKII